VAVVVVEVRETGITQQLRAVAVAVALEWELLAGL
jgi:hypothetical protein